MGEFLTYTIDFITVAFVMFLIIKSINRLKAKEDELPSGPTDNQLLSEIRDLLKNIPFFRKGSNNLAF